MEKIELAPIRESTSDYDIIEQKIISLFKKEIYFPILKELQLSRRTFKNAITPLEDAIHMGKITFSKGTFSGDFNSSISKELRELGARWDPKTKTYKINLKDLPMKIRGMISVSEFRYREKIEALDKKISELVPEEIAQKLHISSQLDSTLWKVEKDFQKSIENITVVPQLTDEQRKKIADEWQNNLRLYVKKFTEEQIPELRKQIQENVFKGNRRESMIKTIQESYGVSQNKAKFLARQETNLLMSKYKETKYTAAGSEEYIWGCVKMPHQSSPNIPYKPGDVRYSHGILEGKTFRWDNPPITTAPGETVRKNNPGCDYNCRCFARPLIRFNKNFLQKAA